MNTLLRMALPVADLIMMPFVYPVAGFMRGVRRAGVERLPRCRRALRHVGVFPIRDHYYEPQFSRWDPGIDFDRERELPGIRWNLAGQLAMLQRFTFGDELANLPREKPASTSFYVDNPAFGPGDAEYWYQIIRTVKPRRIVEIGSGHSTLMASRAVGMNCSEDARYACEHVCIEPYEMPWLEETDVSVVREKVEDLEPAFFARLEENDILFIDSSHMIRPHGDVLFEFLQVLPTLAKGVIVHVHDIFSPRNYPRRWIVDEVRLWNEQYLLEAFLSHNESWSIVGALNLLHHQQYEELKAIAPFLTPEREPGSFYMQKTA